MADYDIFGGGGDSGVPYVASNNFDQQMTFGGLGMGTSYQPDAAALQDQQWNQQWNDAQLGNPSIGSGASDLMPGYDAQGNYTGFSGGMSSFLPSDQPSGGLGAVGMGTGAPAQEPSMWDQVKDWGSNLFGGSKPAPMTREQALEKAGGNPEIAKFLMGDTAPGGSGGTAKDDSWGWKEWGTLGALGLGALGVKKKYDAQKDQNAATQQNNQAAMDFLFKGNTPGGGGYTPGDTPGWYSPGGASGAGGGLGGMVPTHSGDWTNYGADALDYRLGTQGAYQNPYLEQVVDTTLRDYDQNAIGNLLQTRGDAAKRGAFGTARADLYDADLVGQLAKRRADTEAGLRFGAFDKASGLASKDLENAVDLSKLAELSSQNDVGNQLAMAQFIRGQPVAANPLGDLYTGLAGLGLGYAGRNQA